MTYQNPYWGRVIGRVRGRSFGQGRRGNSGRIIRRKGIFGNTDPRLAVVTLLARPPLADRQLAGALARDAQLLRHLIIGEPPNVRHDVSCSGSSPWHWPSDRTGVTRVVARVRDVAGHKAVNEGLECQ